MSLGVGHDDAVILCCSGALIRSADRRPSKERVLELITMEVGWGKSPEKVEK